MPTSNTRDLIYAQITEERYGQDRQWGGKLHDDEHKKSLWRRILAEHVERLRKEKGDSWRHRLVVIAALCVAAIEAHDRKERGST
jgi:hypothetical protein